MNTQELKALSADIHGDLKIDEKGITDILRQSHLLMLRAREVTQAACCFPVFFTQAPAQGDNGMRKAISALCAFEPNKNLFAGDTWKGGFTPISVNAQPFVLIKADNEKGYTFSLNTQHPAVNTATGESVFDGEKPSLYTQNKTRLLESSIQEDGLTYQALEKLHSLDLIADVDMVIEYQDGTKQAVTGLATVNEQALVALNADSLHELQKNGLLMLLHAMLISLYQVNSLIQLHNQQEGASLIANVKFESPKQRHAGEAY